MNKLLNVICLTCLIQTPAILANMQDDFWKQLVALKGSSFEGKLAIGTEPSDKEFMAGKAVMYIWKADANEIRIPFHIGENRSRTWVLTRTGTGIRLKHDHRHEDGTDDKLTQYGGDSFMKGTPIRQEFKADKYTADLLPASANNIWAMEVEPGKRFVYELRREHEDRFFRVEFDLSKAVETPPPAWGDEVRSN